MEERGRGAGAGAGAGKSETRWSGIGGFCEAWDDGGGGAAGDRGCGEAGQRDVARYLSGAARRRCHSLLK
jgi:hypothetical protein